MLDRCSNPNSPAYASYGARGITVCERWRTYPNFICDVGRRPSKEYSIDRRDNDGNYEPGNVYWATRKQQARNRRSSRLITALGKTMTEAEWVEFTGIKQGTLSCRLNRYGWEPDRAMSTPVMSREEICYAAGIARKSKAKEMVA